MQSKPTSQQVYNIASEDTHPGWSSGLTTGSGYDGVSLQATPYSNPGSRHMLQNLVAQKHGHSEGRLEGQVCGAQALRGLTERAGLHLWGLHTQDP